jgi:hypothetical protein
MEETNYLSIAWCVYYEQNDLMKIKTLLTITAILSFLNGLFYLFAPELSLSLLGGTTNAIGVLNTRYFGAAALGIGVIAWFARNIYTWEFQRIIVIGIFTTLSISAIIGFAAIRSGVFNEVGWLIVGADSFLSIGFLLIFIRKLGSN